MSMHIGDRILEINGTPVKDISLENVENLLRYSESVLQVTIEHDPDAIPKKKLLPIQQYTIPLTTTASDTNIPNNNINNEVKSYNSNHSIDNNNSSNSIDSLKNKSNPDIAKNVPTKKGPVTRIGDRERLFKRRDEGYMSGTRSRQLKRKNNLCEKQSLDKERSSSMSRLLDE